MRASSVELMQNLALSVRRNQDAEEVKDLDSQILTMRFSGSTVKEIAESLGLSPVEVRASIKAAVRDAKDNLEQTTRSEILMESVSFMRHARDLQMMAASDLDACAYRVNKQGAIVPKKLDVSERANLIRTRAALIKDAVNIEKNIQEVFIKTGVLPRQAEQINVSIGDMRAPSMEDDEIVPEVAGEDIRNRAELLEEIHGHLVVARHLRNSDIDIPEDAIVLDDLDNEDMS